MTLFQRTLTKGPVQGLFLHCGLGQSGMWKAVAANLDGQCTVIAADLPGHGKSPPFPEGVDVHTAATDAVRPLFASGMHLVGHSFGATVALRLALERPADVASLTLVEPVFFAAARGRSSFDPHRSAEEGLFETYQTKGTLAAARVFNRLWGGGVPWDSFRPMVQQSMAEGMPFVIGTEPSLWQDCHGLLAPGGLEQLICPVTLLRGSQTVDIIEDVHAGLMSRIAQAREVLVPGAGHMVIMSHAEDVAAAISETMARA